jgi:hypothetical protein
MLSSIFSFSGEIISYHLPLSAEMPSGECDGLDDKEKYRRL